MEDELEVCAAALFRSKGKDVVTEKEFTMSVTLDLKWMSAKEATLLMKKLVAKNILTRSNGYLKSAKDLTSLQVPIAYRPSDDLKKSLTDPEKPATEPAAPKKDLFGEMMDIAVECGIPKGKFVSESNLLKKKIGIDVCVAALLILRDNGYDIEKIKDRVMTQILEN